MTATFKLVRKEDVTGVSGTGHVADGVKFEDGVCVVRWKGKFATTTVHESLTSIEHIHLHEGRTELVWTVESLAERVVDGQTSAVLDEIAARWRIAALVVFSVAVVLIVGWVSTP